MTLTAKQLEVRKRGLGSSDIAAVAGLNPWRKPIDVFLEKTGRAEASTATIRTRVGHALEEQIAKLYAEDTGCVLAPGSTVVSKNEPWLVATPDFIARLGTDEFRILEIKVVGSRVAHHWSDGLPDYVLAQIIHQQRVTEIHVGACAALIGGTDFQAFDCPYLPEVSDDLAEIGREFWHEHVLKDIPPPIDASDSWKRYIDSRWPKDLRPMIEASAEANALAKDLALARARLDQAAEDKARLENELKVLIGEHAGIRGDGWQVSFKTAASGGVDYKALCEELGATPEQIAKYKRAGSRRFLFSMKGE